MGPYTKPYPKPSNKNTKTTIPLLVNRLKRDLAESKRQEKLYKNQEKYTAALHETLFQENFMYVLALIKNGIEE